MSDCPTVIGGKAEGNCENECRYTLIFGLVKRRRWRTRPQPAPRELSGDAGGAGHDPGTTRVNALLADAKPKMG